MWRNVIGQWEICIDLICRNRLLPHCFFLFFDKIVFMQKRFLKMSLICTSVMWKWNTVLYELLLSNDLLDFLWIFIIYTLGNRHIGMVMDIDWESLRSEGQPWELKLRVLLTSETGRLKLSSWFTRLGIWMGLTSSLCKRFLLQTFFKQTWLIEMSLAA